MTEAEWLKCEMPRLMTEFIRTRTSDRKGRLYICLCCRKLWDRLTDPASRNVIEVSERFADGLASEVELRAAREAAFDVEQGLRPALNQLPRGSPEWAAAKATFNLFCLAADSARSWLGSALYRASVVGVETSWQMARIRDIFGNPFRPCTFDAAWGTDTVLSLARHMYETRDFSAMPILADALQDADCDNADILGHCRGEGPHVRGCWVVDLILGKA